MGYAGIIRDAILLLNSETKSLQVKQQISIYRFVSNQFGDDTYEDTATVVDAIVEMNPKATYRRDGVELPVVAKILVLKALSFIIHPKDKVVLQDGTTGPIVDLPSLLDPTTNRPYFAEISLGQSGGV